MCTMVLKEVIDFHTKHGPSYSTVLDATAATKAFDRIVIASCFGNFLIKATVTKREHQSCHSCTLCCGVATGQKNYL